MSDQPANEIPPELQEWIDAEISVEGLNSPADEREVRDIIARLPGVNEPAISGGVVAVRYDPVATTKAEICESLKKAGYRIADVAAVADSPITDALS